MTRTAEGTDGHAPTQADADRDRKLEVLLDELVAIPVGDELPADFASRVLARREFAPWEVARPSHWRLPLGVGLGLLGGSLGLGLTPLWSLGPGTAVTVWADLLAVAFGRPVATLVTALPVLAEGTARVAGAVAPGAALALAGAALLALVSLGAALSRLQRSAAPAAVRRA